MLTSTEIRKLEDDLRSAVQKENFQQVEEYVKKAKKKQRLLLSISTLLLTLKIGMVTHLYQLLLINKI